MKANSPDPINSVDVTTRAKRTTLTEAPLTRHGNMVVALSLSALLDHSIGHSLFTPVWVSECRQIITISRYIFDKNCSFLFFNFSPLYVSYEYNLVVYSFKENTIH